MYVKWRRQPRPGGHMCPSAHQNRWSYISFPRLFFSVERNASGGGFTLGLQKHKQFAGNTADKPSPVWHNANKQIHRTQLLPFVFPSIFQTVMHLRNGNMHRANPMMHCVNTMPLEGAMSVECACVGINNLYGRQGGHFKGATLLFAASFPLISFSVAQGKAQSAL